MPLRPSITLSLLGLAAPAFAASGPLDCQFAQTVRPFVDTYCAGCHGAEKQEAELDLRGFTDVAKVVHGFAYWELVLERLEAGDMPPSKAKKHPAPAESGAVIAWLHALRRAEAAKNAGDPGPVLARRLSNAEYDYSVLDLTGADIRPTKEFPVDPANQAGFDNSGESLAMSPALVKKYLEAARTVSEHLVLKPDGIAFAPHPVVADTDRDKWGVLRIVDFYKRQPVDLADYFAAAWRYRHRAALGRADTSLAAVAAEARVSARYLERVWALLVSADDDVGPLATLRARWRALPAPAADAAVEAELRRETAALRDWVVTLRAKLAPVVPNLTATGINNGSQTLVLWKNRQMAANRRRYDPTALHIEGTPIIVAGAGGPGAAAPAKPPGPAAPATTAPQAAPSATPAAAAKKYNPAQPGIADIVRKGGKFLAPAITTTASSATFQMAAAKNRAGDPDLEVPADPAERARHEASFARFADVFPDAFFITERARVYLDAAKEQDNAGRLLSAGLHSMTGYFRDDGPLCELILDDAGRRELDRLWQEFEFVSSVPQRMHTSFAWFERTDSSFMRDTEFDPYRPEDKSIVEPAKVEKLGELYLAKARTTGASDAVQAAIAEHFAIVAANLRRVAAERVAAEPTHLAAVVEWAERAYRRPLTAAERADLLAFYRAARTENGLDHEEAVRDLLARVLMSPHFNYRIDLGVATGGSGGTGAPPVGPAATVALSDHALASRLSYFLWSGLPDAALLARAAAGELQRPEVLAAEARRMLADPRARRLATEFGGHWLDFRRFEEHNGVDRERFPTFDHALRAAMFAEPVRFLEHLIRTDGPMLDCLYGDYTFVNAPLARHYGLPAPAATDDTWTRVDGVSAHGRGGLLPMAVFLTYNSPGLRTSPVKRGYWVVRRVLGERIPPPPAAVPDLPGDEAKLDGLTVREALARHRDDPACAGCHARFDAFGLVFEGYGAVGERRTHDFGGKPVDTRAEFAGGTAGSGLAGLRDHIRAHRERDFTDNLARKLLAYGLGRTLLLSDDPLVEAMTARFAADGHRFSTLVEAIVTSPQFRLKRAHAPGVAQVTTE